MVVNEESGLLVSPGDEHELAKGMDRLLSDPDLRARLAAGAQERVRQFTASSVAERLETVYARVAPQAGISPNTYPASVDGREADRS
jgi:glycogen(starch) synthase